MLSPTTQDTAGLAAANRPPPAAARTAPGPFGEAHPGRPEFAALLAAESALSADATANAAIEAFGNVQAELRTEAMMGILTAAQRAELERLQKAMLAVPTVATYIAATATFQAVCRETAAVVSAQIGIDFAANCRSGGCCG